MSKQFLTFLGILLLVATVLMPPASTGEVPHAAPPQVEKGEDFTHNVLLELFVTTWCDRCPTSEEASVELNMEYGEHFSFVTMICDVNDDANARSEDYLVETYPTAIFDGGDEDDRASENDSSGESDKDRYEGHIESCGGRDVDATPVDLSVDVQDLGDGEVRVSYSATYTNTDPTASQWFDCHIRVYVTERVSRYNNLEDEPIPYGFLDYAFDEDLRLLNQAEQTDQVDVDTDGGEFDNIVVIAAIFDKRTGVEQYVVQTATTEENIIQISDVEWSPEYPENTDDMSFWADVAGNVDKVELEYAICTDGMCGAPEYVTMDLEDDTTYTATVGDFGSDAESIHFRIIATDPGGRETKSPLEELYFGQGGGGDSDDQPFHEDPNKMGWVAFAVLVVVPLAVHLIDKRDEDEEEWDEYYEYDDEEYYDQDHDEMEYDEEEYYESWNRNMG